MNYWEFDHGRFVEVDEATISLSDTSYQFGLGVFETLLWDGSKLLELNEHIERLSGSCNTLLNKDIPSELRDVIGEVGFGSSEQRVKILTSVENDELSIKLSAQDYSRSTVPIKLVKSDYQVNESSPLSGHKTTSYAHYLLALQEAKALGADEALLLNSQGMLCECATSNVFFHDGEKWLTPSLDSGCLPGVMRGKLIQALLANGEEVVEGLFTLSALEQAKRVIITNSLRRVQEVASFGDIQFELGGLSLGELDLGTSTV